MVPSHRRGFARGCSPSDIYSGLVSRRYGLVWRGQSYGRGDPGQPCRAGRLQNRAIALLNQFAGLGFTRWASSPAASRANVAKV